MELDTEKMDSGVKLPHSYKIAGKVFELRPQTLRQRQLAAPVWNKIVATVRDTVALQVEKDKTIVDFLNISIRTDEFVLSDDNSFPKFLATILSPLNEPWTPACIEQNYELMRDIDEQTEAEVISDFMSRWQTSKKNLPNSTPISTSTMSKSPPSGE